MSSTSDSALVVSPLVASPVNCELVLARRDLLPAKPGFYAWWMRRNALAEVPHNPHPHDDSIGLLYVGISPSRSSSRQTINSRVRGNHVRGNTASSTFQPFESVVHNRWQIKTPTHDSSRIARP